MTLRRGPDLRVNDLETSVSVCCINALSDKMQNISHVAPAFQTDTHEHTEVRMQHYTLLLFYVFYILCCYTGMKNS